MLSWLSSSTHVKVNVSNQTWNRLFRIFFLRNNYNMLLTLQLESFPPRLPSTLCMGRCQLSYKRPLARLFRNFKIIHFSPSLSRSFLSLHIRENCWDTSLLYEAFFHRGFYFLVPVCNGLLVSFLGYIFLKRFFFLGILY